MDDFNIDIFDFNKTPENEVERTMEYFENLEEGLLAYNIPDTMLILESYKVTVSIKKSLNDSILFYKLESAKFKLEHVKISSLVKVNLIDPTNNQNFSIVSLNTPEQVVNGDINTTWKWNVIPLRR